MSYSGRRAFKFSLSAVAAVVSVSDSAGYQRIGSFAFGTLNYPDVQVILSALLETTGPAAQLRLFNVTDGVVVGADPLLTTSSIVESLQEADITALLSSATKIYDVQLKLASGTTPDAATCGQCEAKVAYSEFG